MEIVIKELDSGELEHACHTVIDALSSFPKEIKIGALHVLIEEWPEPYEIIERTK